jgi:hypothetical protein
MRINAPNLKIIILLQLGYTEKSTGLKKIRYLCDMNIMLWERNIATRFVLVQIPKSIFREIH